MYIRLLTLLQMMRKRKRTGISRDIRRGNQDGYSLAVGIQKHDCDYWAWVGSRFVGLIRA